MATEQDIEALKRNWEEDPCWDIEHTEGFEAHADELRAHRLKMETRWAEERKARETAAVTAKALQLGVPDNHDLARYVLGLERRLNHLEEKLLLS